MRALIISLVPYVVCFAPHLASADVTKTECVDANSTGQDLRRDGKLAAARAQFRKCADPSCPGMVRDDCTRRLDELERMQPTVLFEAKDVAGNGIPGVRVSMDGQLLVEKIEGRSVGVDPGTHTFVFETSDGRRAEKTMVVGEGEKETRVSLRLPNPAAPASLGETRAVRTGMAPEVPSMWPPWKVIGLGAGGLGVVGIGVGAVFGVMASNKKNDSGCKSDGMCANNDDANTLRAAQTDGNLATVFFVAGGVLAAAGVTVFLLVPGSNSESPRVGIGPQGAVLSAGW